MINNLNKIKFLEKQSLDNVLDVEMNDKGDIFILKGVKYNADNSLTGGEIFKNGVQIDSYLSQLPSTAPRVYSGNSQEIYSEKRISIPDGFIDNEGNYTIYGIYNENEPFESGNFLLSHQTLRCFALQSATNSITYFDCFEDIGGSETPHDDEDIAAGWITKYHFHIEAETFSFHFPMQDGFYYTFSTIPVVSNLNWQYSLSSTSPYETYPNWSVLDFYRQGGVYQNTGEGGLFNIKIFDKSDNEILSLNFFSYVPYKISFCKFKNGFLIYPYRPANMKSANYSFYHLDSNGNDTQKNLHLTKGNSRTLMNFRLRPNNNFNFFNSCAKSYLEK